MGFIALVTRVIALACPWLGAWLILPFAGIELLVLFLALRCMERHARDCERPTIHGDIILRIEGGEVGLRAANLLPIVNLTHCWSLA